MADVVEQNKAHFNQLAKEYDAKHGKTAETLTTHIRSLKDFIGADWVNEDENGTEKKEVRLLDYACGTGLVSQALAPWITSAVGIDITENMVEIYNTKANNQGLSEDEMHAYLGDICNPPSEPPAGDIQAASPSPTPDFGDAKFYNFDVAGVGLGFHHFIDPTYAAKQLSQRLKSGSGVLFIIDFLPHDELTHGHAAKHTITAHGFSKEQIKGVFEAAGCGKDFALTEMGNGVVFEGMGPEKKASTRHVFLARGTKE